MSLIYQNSDSTNSDALEYALIANKVHDRYVERLICRLMWSAQEAQEPPRIPEASKVEET